MSVSYKEVAEILKIIDSSQCEEVILEIGETRLVVKRGTDRLTNNLQAPDRRANSAETRSPSEVTDISDPETKTSSTAVDSGKTHIGTIVRAPMVGTFYRRPAPDEAPFVKVGSKVTVGDPLCMIEVMKLYTTIQASISGTVEAVLADDTELVEFDQPLFNINPDEMR